MSRATASASSLFLLQRRASQYSFRTSAANDTSSGMSGRRHGLSIGLGMIVFPLAAQTGSDTAAVAPEPTEAEGTQTRVGAGRSPMAIRTPTIATMAITITTSGKLELAAR